MNSTDTYVNPQTCLTRYFADFTLFLKLQTPNNFGSHYGNKFSFAVCSKNFRSKPVEISVGIKLTVQSALVGIS